MQFFRLDHRAEQIPQILLTAEIGKARKTADLKKI